MTVYVSNESQKNISNSIKAPVAWLMVGLLKGYHLTCAIWPENPGEIAQKYGGCDEKWPMSCQVLFNQTLGGVCVYDKIPQFRLLKWLKPCQGANLTYYLIFLIKIGI